ncbi:hypothetical protein OZN62_09205 [Aurantiacibacter sp. MUD11]|uniref:hypothetical protein n=1 Tax=Aurantiacibacter sp. MUD11 TaxID=3003265 RepID=UPI0022AA9E47|nr:hypothetical protein [Aurantiacibacter sp. MUD11]WAT17113.1 hypothetical protein OZN62_09205 [Aurantiacibacter sp. MUD11]
MSKLSDRYLPMMGRQFLFGLAFDLLIAVILVSMFGSEDDWLFETLFVFVGILGLEVAIGAKSWLAKGAWAFLFGKKFVEEAVFEALQDAMLPAPMDYHRRGFDYLADLADDPEANPDDRVKAVVLFTSMSMAWSREGIVRQAAYRAAADDAAARWLRQLPRVPN